MKATSEDFKFFIETMINAAQNKPTLLSEKEKQQLAVAIKVLVKQDDNNRPQIKEDYRI